MPPGVHFLCLTNFCAESYALCRGKFVTLQPNVKL